MNMIVAVDNKWAIGKDNRLLVVIPADHRAFRQETMGKVIVYGRNTLSTFPGGMALEGRKNIVLSKNPEFRVKGAVVVHSIQELERELKEYDTKAVHVIGGESVYRQLLPMCDTVHVTKIDHVYDADAWFPNLHEMEEWCVTADSEEQYYFDLAYVFQRYERRPAVK